jgi:hypothetical protein
MKRPIGGACAATFLCALLSLLAPNLHGQAQAPAPGDTAEGQPRLGRIAAGIRVRVFPDRSLGTMGNNHAMSTLFVASIPYDSAFDTSSSSPRYGGGGALEFTLGPKTSLEAEFLFGQLRYTQNSVTYWGSYNPESGSDTRSTKSVVEATNARLWDVPLMIRHKGMRPSGLFSHLFVAGGATAREVSNVRTTTNTTLSGTTTTSRTTAPVAKRTIVGATVGLGFQFVDDFGIRVTPEIRYTRWLKGTFATQSAISAKDQLEIGLSITR